MMKKAMRRKAEKNLDVAGSKPSKASFTAFSPIRAFLQIWVV
jgi:hypothetical protein